MTIDEILEQLETLTGVFPTAAVQAAIDQREAIVPRLLVVLDEVAADPEPFAAREDYMLHLFALYLLAQFREKRAFPLVVRFATADPESVEDLLGDDVPTTLGRVLASTFAGDTGPIHRLVENREAGDWSRCAGIRALVILARAGLVPPDDVRRYFKRLFEGALEREPSDIWDELTLAVVTLPAPELFAEARRACEDELCFDESEDSEESEAGSESPATAEAEDDDDGAGDFDLVGDVFQELGSWDCFEVDDDGGERGNAIDVDAKVSIDGGNFPDELPPGEPLPPGAVLYDPAAQAPKVARNDPCPCGSGKKYKKCCGA